MLNFNSRVILGKYNLFFIGGNFNNAGGQALSRFAIVNDQGFCSDWYPTFNGAPNTILLEDSVLYLGGAFTNYNNSESTYLCKIVYPWEGFTVSNKPAINNQLNSGIYPNPAKDKIVIRIESPASNSAQCSIYNQNGKLVQQEIVWMQHGLADLDLPNGLKPGLYIVKLSSGSQYSTHKLLIEQ